MTQQQTPALTEQPIVRSGRSDDANLKILWEQNGLTEQGICLIEVGNRVSIEITGSLIAGVQDTEVQSIADLIAAAPDLLAALVNLEAYLRSTPHHNAVEAAAARAAIRSAT